MLSEIFMQINRILITLRLLNLGGPVIIIIIIPHRVPVYLASTTVGQVSVSVYCVCYDVCCHYNSA